MRRAMMTALAVAMAVFAGDVCARGADGAGSTDNPCHWKPRTKSVAVFKNGLGFFIREGEAGLRDGWCVAKQVPPATFGTLAVYSTNEKETVDIIGYGPGEVVDFDDQDAPKTVAAKRDRLESSRNLQVQLTYDHNGSARTSAGTLVSVGEEFAVLETQDSNYAVPIEEITRMQLLDLPMRIHVAGPDAGAPERTALGMAYLRKGITWIPEYTLKMIDDETGELTLRGTLVNEAEDLIHCDVHFVVGVPHFEHVEYMAPIAVGQMIRTMGAALAPTQVQTQIMSRAAITSNIRGADQFDRGPAAVDRPAAPEGGDLGKALGDLPQLGGAAATDYTVYTKKDLTLRRGEKAIVTLFVKTIKYSHVYHWSPPERMKHMLVLQNDTDTPWTTGP